MRQTIPPGLFLGGAVLLCAAWLAARPPVAAIEMSTRGGARPTQVDRPSIELDAAILERYTGRYDARGDLTVTLTLRDGKLFAQSPGTVPFELRATSETGFFLKGANIDVEFDVGRDGAVRGFVANTEFGVVKARRAR